MTCENMFEFKEIKGGYELARYYEKGRTYRVEIPGQYNGKPVLRIGAQAFEYNGSFEVIRIPPEVKDIGRHAFGCCYRLSAVEFSEGLKRIGSYAFSYCDNDLISLKFPKGLKYVGDGAFASCLNLESVTFSDPETKLGTNVFFRCFKLPAKAQLINILCSPDITAPMPRSAYTELSDMKYRMISCYTDPLFRKDVFALAVQNKCFRNAQRKQLADLFETLTFNRFWELIRIAVNGELLPDAELTEKMIGVSVKNDQTELTAMLLEYKRSKFGFNGGNEFEI